MQIISWHLQVLKRKSPEAANVDEDISQALHDASRQGAHASNRIHSAPQCASVYTARTLKGKHSWERRKSHVDAVNLIRPNRALAWKDVRVQGTKFHALMFPCAIAANVKIRSVQKLQKQWLSWNAITRLVDVHWQKVPERSHDSRQKNIARKMICTCPRALGIIMRPCSCTTVNEP